MYFFYLFNLSHSLKGVISWSNAKFSKLTWWELYIDSKENCYWDHKSEMIKLVGTTCKKLVLEGKHYWVHCSLAKCNLISFKCQNMIYFTYICDHTCQGGGKPSACPSAHQWCFEWMAWLDWLMMELHLLQSTPWWYQGHGHHLHLQSDRCG